MENDYGRKIVVLDIVVTEVKYYHCHTDNSTKNFQSVHTNSFKL